MSHHLRKRDVLPQIISTVCDVQYHKDTDVWKTIPSEIYCFFFH